MRLPFRTISARLAFAAGLAAIAALVLAGFSAYANHASGAALQRLYEQDVRALVQLQKIDGTLREVRFRVAGVLRETMPVPGSLNHLRESRKEIEAGWAELRESLQGSAHDD